MRARRTLAVLAAAATLGAPFATAAQAATVHVSVVVSGLNNPKHLGIGPDGQLYVATSGTGDPSMTNCVPSVGDGGVATQDCVAKTGAILHITGHGRSTTLGGLESVQEIDNGEISGASGFAWDKGKLAVVMQDTDGRSNGANGLPGGDEFGKVVLAAPHSARSTWVLGPDLAAYAAEHPQANPGGTPGEVPTDSDPYDITAYRGGFAVVDAASNAVLWISPTGKISLLARLPAVPETVPAGFFGPTAVTIRAQAVPTSVVAGPDGALYVGGIRGVPSLPGTADVYRVFPGHAATVWATGFSAISDLAFDPQGRLLVLELSTGGLLGLPKVGGALIRVNLNHTRTTLLTKGLNAPTGVAVTSTGTIYISNNGTGSATAAQPGQILKLTF